MKVEAHRVVSFGGSNEVGLGSCLGRNGVG